MAIDSIRSDLSLPLKSGRFKSEIISDDDFVQLIVNPISSKKDRARATRQIKIYFKRISSHPEKRGFYINLIKDLIQFEIKNIKRKRED